MTLVQAITQAPAVVSRLRRAAKAVASPAGIPLALIALFVIAFTIQINLPPLERFPGWDHFWVDAMSVGKLAALRDAVTHGELPALTPYVNFDENLAGDPSSPVSVLSPLNLLVLLLPIRTAIVIRTMVLLALGGWFAFALLRRVTGDTAVALLAALTYLVLPYTIGLHYHYAMAVTFLVLPMVVFQLLDLAVRPTRRRVLFFGLAITAAVATGDVHTGLTLGVAVFLGTATIAWQTAGIGLIRSLWRAVALSAVVALASLFYLVPLAVNMRTVASQMKALEAAGLYAGAGLTARQVVDFVYRYGIESVFKPLEGSGLLLYAPSFVLFAVAFGLAFQRTLFPTREQRGLFFVLTGLAVVMFVVCPGLYLLPGGVMSNARGVLRLPLNAFPFMMTLAAFCCLAAVRRSTPLRGPVLVLLVTMPLALDVIMFRLEGPALFTPLDATSRLFTVTHDITAPFRDSNLVDVRNGKDMWKVLPWANFALFALAVIAPLKTADSRWRKLGWAGWAAAAVVAALFYGSLQNTLRMQQEPWQWLTRNSYRYDTYSSRKACTDALVDRRDSNFRTLYVGAGRLGPTTGRDWQLIAETELHQVDRSKALFSYRETMHPYAGVMRGLFVGSPIVSNAMPPLASELSGKIWMLRMMGVRWVISVAQTIDNPDLAYMGSCLTPPSPIEDEPSGGSWHVYELRDPTGVAFLTGQYRKLDQAGAFRVLLSERQQPLRTGTVFLEDDVNLKRAADGATVAGGEARIVAESYGQVDVITSAPEATCLVLSYAYRPWWSVTVDARREMIHRAYGGFMSVIVPAGRHRVRFDYAPVDVRMGILLSFAGIAAAVAGVRFI